MLFLLAFRINEDKNFAPIVPIFISGDRFHQQRGTDGNQLLDVVSGVPEEYATVVDLEITDCDLFTEAQYLRPMSRHLL